MKKIATIGEYLVDMIPINNAYQPTPGGAPMNVAIAIQRLNGNVIPLAQVGKDFFGKMLKDALIDEELDTSYIKTDEKHKTSLAFVSIDAHGERDFMFYRNPSADQFFTLDHNDIQTLDFDILHFGSVGLLGYPLRETTDALIQYANDHHKIISFDVNVRLMLVDDEQKYKEDIVSYMKKSHLVKCSLEELIYLNHHEASIQKMVEQLFDLNHQMVMITKGSEGVQLFYKNHIFNQKAFSVDVVDTTGAGDAFMGSFLWSLSKQENPFDSIEWIPKALEISSYVSSQVITKKGATEGLPYYKDILRFF
jgi:fructokinase